MVPIVKPESTSGARITVSVSVEKIGCLLGLKTGDYARAQLFALSGNGSYPMMRAEAETFKYGVFGADHSLILDSLEGRCHGVS